MRRLLRATCLVAGGLLVLSCTSDRQRFPTQSPNFESTATPANHGQVEQRIAHLFPQGDLRREANDRLQAIQDALTHGDTPTAQQLARDLVAFGVPLCAGGELMQNCGVSPDPYLDFIRALYEYVGLKVPFSTEGIQEDGAVQFVGPEGATVVTEPLRMAGVRVPADPNRPTFLLVISKLSDEPAPLPTELRQIRPFYDFSDFPEVLFTPMATVGICQFGSEPEDVLDHYGSLRLAHPNPLDRSTLEILDYVYPPFLSHCANPPPNVGSGFLGRLGDVALGLVRPRPLFAATLVEHGGVGGEVTSFSPFGVIVLPALATIDFETLPDGTPACDNCALTTAYGSRGVVFSFTSGFTGLTNAQLFLSSPVYDPVEGPVNHSVTSAAAPEGGFFSGVVRMTFTRSPRSVSFQARGNNSIEVFPVTATDRTGASIPGGQITRSGVSTYTPASAVGPFRQETVTITSSAGIRSVDVEMNGFIVLIDNLVITP